MMEPERCGQGPRIVCARNVAAPEQNVWSRVGSGRAGKLQCCGNTDRLDPGPEGPSHPESEDKGKELMLFFCDF
ncbi:hypothetical protein AV530_002858 [Patagioenas fasciata monilis]|uniref:Uncharacterized protein n=1 Tax=Patagioenas fasciata monilis TaxID=372326 RepID=A0A1V4K9Q8_PATFA|nr:hypothetical protein AV530_002858 [Patagioenas fasciata monilis]